MNIAKRPLAVSFATLVQSTDNNHNEGRPVWGRVSGPLPPPTPPLPPDNYINILYFAVLILLTNNESNKEFFFKKLYWNFFNYSLQMCLYCSYVFEHFYEAGNQRKPSKAKLNLSCKKKKKKCRCPPVEIKSAIWYPAPRGFEAATTSRFLGGKEERKPGSGNRVVMRLNI